MNIIKQEDAYSLLSGKYHIWDNDDTERLKITEDDGDNWDIVNSVSIGNIEKLYAAGDGFDKLEIHSIIQSSGLNSDYKWVISVIKGVNEYIAYTTPMQWRGSWSYTQKEDTYYLCKDIEEVKELVLNVSSDPWWGK